jgi:RNA polymerase sigma-70 factor (ECF subfamily)
VRHLDDDQLIRAFVAGRDAALGELMRRHGPAIKGYATRMLQSPQQGEEVYVDTFARVATARDRWEPRGSVRGYLFTIAHRICLDILRQRKVARLAVPHLVELADARPPSPSPEAQALLKEQAEELEAALHRLPHEHRQVVLMRVVHGLSAAETAAALGISEDQVHSELSYARKRLHSLVAAPSARLEA